MHGEPEPDERREISYHSFLGGYLVLLISLVTVGVVGQAWLGIDLYRSASVLGGILFLVAGIGVPRRLYLIVRSTGWFSFVEDPRVMRGLLVVLGVGLIIMGLLASTASLHS